MRTPKEICFKKVIIGAVMFTLLSFGYADEIEISSTQSLFAQPISLKLADWDSTNSNEFDKEAMSLRNLDGGSHMKLKFDQSQADNSAFDTGKQPVSGLNSVNQLTLDAKPSKVPRVNQNLREETIASPQAGAETTPNDAQRQFQIRANERPNRFFKTKGNQ